MTEGYKRAIEVHNAALNVFHKVQAQYRAQEIGDNEFIAAKEICDKAGLMFDLAFTAEAEREAEDNQTVFKF